MCRDLENAHSLLFAGASAEKSQSVLPRNEGGPPGSWKSKIKVYSLFFFLLCLPPNLTSLKSIITTLVARKDVSKEKMQQGTEEGVKESVAPLLAPGSSQCKGTSQGRFWCPQFLGSKQTPRSWNFKGAVAFPHISPRWSNDGDWIWWFMWALSLMEGGQV